MKYPPPSNLVPTSWGNGGTEAGGIESFLFWSFLAWFFHDGGCPIASWNGVDTSGKSEIFYYWNQNLSIKLLPQKTNYCKFSSWLSCYEFLFVFFHTIRGVLLKKCTKNMFTARIRRMGKVMFSVCSHLGGRGVRVKGQSSRGGQVKGQSSQRGVRSKVNPAGGGSGQRSIQPGGERVSILRPLAGGMPLAFTQEDFLVPKCFLNFPKSQYCRKLNCIVTNVDYSPRPKESPIGQLNSRLVLEKRKTYECYVLSVRWFEPDLWATKVKSKFLSQLITTAWWVTRRCARLYPWLGGD